MLIPDCFITNIMTTANMYPYNPSTKEAQLITCQPCIQRVSNSMISLESCGVSVVQSMYIQITAPDGIQSEETKVTLKNGFGFINHRHITVETKESDKVLFVFNENLKIKKRDKN